MRRKVKNYKFFGNYDYYVPGAPDIFILLALLLLGAVIAQLPSLILLAYPNFDQSALMLVAYPLMFIPAMVFAGFKSKMRRFDCGGVKLDRCNCSPLGALPCGVLAAIATLALAFVCDLCSFILPDTPKWFEEAMSLVTEGNIIINFISVSIFAPLFEEWLCRGMVLRGLLSHKVKPLWAIVLSALFFAFIHLNPWQALPAFILGCLMGYVYYKTGSLKLTMLMHFTNNSFSLLLSNIDAFKEMENWSDVMSAESYWLCMAICLLLLILIVKQLSKINAPSFEEGCEPDVVDA